MWSLLLIRIKATFALRGHQELLTGGCAARNNDAKERTMSRTLYWAVGLSALLAVSGCFSTDGIVYTRNDLGAKVPIVTGDYVCVNGIGLGKHPWVSHMQIVEKALPEVSRGQKYEYQLPGGSVQFAQISGSLYLVDVSEPAISDDGMPTQALRAAFVEENTLQMLAFATDVVFKVAANSGVAASHDPIMGWKVSGTAEQQRNFFGALLANTTGVTVDQACALDAGPASAEANR
jgi:hypothetical protein